MFKQLKKLIKNVTVHTLMEEVLDWIRPPKEIDLKAEKEDMEAKEDSEEANEGLQEILEIQPLSLVKMIKMLRRDQLALLLERKLHFD